MGGTEIGNNSVIAAGTVLRGEKIPSYSLAIGNPAKIKKRILSKIMIKHNKPTIGPEEKKQLIELFAQDFYLQILK